MSWSRKQWYLVTASIFLGHLTAIFALQSGGSFMGRFDSIPLHELQQESSGAASIVVSPELQDPLVFAAPHPLGFSAAAWIKAPRTEYQVARTQSPPQYLRFAREPSRFGPPEVVPQQAPLPFVALSVTNTPPRQSLVSVEGDLRQRLLLTPLVAPVQYAADVLSNTVVQLAVQADGYPFSARVISGSGSRQADLDALSLAKGMRFAPRLLAAQHRFPAPLEWGEVVFQWFATAPPQTNAVPEALRAGQVRP